ncbi:MAG: hypothetical protein ABI193_14380 [Minicystis sp.]
MSGPSRWKSPALVILVAFAAVAGCGTGINIVPVGSGGGGGDGGGGSGGAGNGPPTLTVTFGAPTLKGQEPDGDQHAIEGYASALGANGDLVAVGTTTKVYAVAAGGPTLLSIVGDEPDLPLTTGEVRAVAPYENGLLVAAENAVFFTTGSALQLSLGNGALHPLGIEAMAARVADDDGDKSNELHLSLLTAQGAYELDAGKLVKWTVEGETHAPTAIFAQKGRVTVAFGHAVYEIDKATKKASPLLFDVGRVREIACGSPGCEEGSLLYFASDAGLIERDANGAYTRFPLAPEGMPALAVETFALDAKRQRLYALAGTSLLRLRAGELPDVVATVEAGKLPRTMAVDKLGDVWLGAGLTLRRLALGTPLSFETDVRPILHEYCAECHHNGTQGAPKLDFESFAVFDGELLTLALKRVKEGTMPPLTYDKKLPKEKVQILEDWSVTKAP